MIVAETVKTPVRNINTADRQADEVLAFAGELGFSARYHFNPHVSVRGSYDLLWVNALALAPDQLTLEPERSRIDLGGTVVYQGITIGVEALW